MCSLMCGRGKSVALIAGAAMLLAGLAGVLSVPVIADDKPATTPAKETTSATKTTDEAKKDKQEKKAENKEEKKEEVKAQEKAKSGLTTGDKATDFTLKDTEGNEVKLSSLLDGKTIVVLQWFNPDCPYVVKHHQDNKTFKDLHQKYKDIKFLAINSGAKGEQGNGLERNQKAVKEYEIAYPVLIDESGTVGSTYGAKRTPELYIVGKDGVIAYHGAIDDNGSREELGKTNYVSKALDEMLKGETVSTSTTRAYGCSVKYGKKN
jgi:peroxiredoxin